VNASCTDDGVTPLHTAAHEGHTEVVKLLLEKNADVNVGCAYDSGLTPLHLAAFNGYTEVVKLLLDNNADVTRCHTFASGCFQWTHGSSETAGS